MTTAVYWDLTNPLKPVGIFDPDAQLPIRFNWAPWLAQEAATYVSHTVTFPENIFEEVSSLEQAGEVLVLLKVAVGQTPAVGAKYPVTCSIEATAGGMTLKDDRTVYLKIVER